MKSCPKCNNSPNLVTLVGDFAQVPVPDVGQEELGQPEEEVDPGDDGQDDEPEPEEDVDLLVDDVLGENAKSVLVLNCTRGTVLVERALRHLFQMLKC